MKKLLLALAAVLMLGGTAFATQTTTENWTGSFHDQVIRTFQTYRVGDITGSTTFQIKNNTAIGFTIRNEDYSAMCSVTKDLRRSGQSGTGTIGCTIPSAPVGLYRLTINPALGGTNNGTLTVVAETDP
jgi:hypothetical protein